MRNRKDFLLVTHFKIALDKTDLTLKLFIVSLSEK
jgi:hypothetical protein